jgi:hypothetical protein
MTERPDWDMDRLLLRYADALASQDWETFGAIWRQAETDRELEAALHELHRGMLEEHASETGLADDAEAVQLLLAEHFPDRPDEPSDPDRPLTAGDVAVRLAADLASHAVRLTAADRAANDALLTSASPLPGQLKQSVLETWCASLGVTASKAYWRTFREAAVRLTMIRSQQRTRLAAAREQTPRKKKDRGDE